MICDRADTQDGLTSVVFEREDLRLVVNNVPARICPACGEAFADEDVTVTLLKQAEGFARLGIRMEVCDYAQPQS
jgi:YgiT-type zinc finger domain-containing protein